MWTQCPCGSRTNPPPSTGTWPGTPTGVAGWADTFGAFNGGGHYSVFISTAGPPDHITA